MPLITLTSDLKSLPYGSDRPGGGSSGLPYVVSPMPDLPPNPQIPYSQAYTNDEFANFLDFYDANKATLDFPIRGGNVQINGGAGAFTTAAGRIDRSRIQAFLQDKQRGSIFLLKQAGLQLTNPNTQVASVLGVGNLIESTRVYNPSGISTLEQVSSQGTGVHFRRHGSVPLYTNLAELTYEDIVKKNNDIATNRLAILATAKLGSQSPIYFTGAGNAIRYGISTINNQILNYQGGPGSTYGIGSTIIKRATNTNTGRTYNMVAFTYDTLMNQEVPTGIDIAHPPLQDFRDKINQQAGNKQFLMSGDYGNAAIQTRLKTGNPGARFNRVNYTEINTVAQDKLNMQGLFYYDTQYSPWSVLQENLETPPDDMIKFVFECLSNDEPGGAIAIFFRSFMTSFTDNNQAELSSFKYLGRGETFRVYQGADRSINFGFKIVAFSREEMRPLYRKLNHLVSQVYPDYSPISKYMRGSIVKLTIGDYLYRVPGFIENVNITIDNNTSWEIVLDNIDSDKDMRQLPHVIDVNCSFKPIHDRLPRRETRENPFVPFIADDNTGYLNSDIPRFDTKDQTEKRELSEQLQREVFGTQRDINGNPIITSPPPNPSNFGDPQRTLNATGVEGGILYENNSMQAAYPGAFTQGSNGAIILNPVQPLFPPSPTLQLNK